MKYHVFRLTNGQDLKDSIISYCQSSNITAAAVVTAVGCVYRASLRLADGHSVKRFDDNYEIVSFEGTVSDNGVHFHVALSDRQGNTIGGHLLSGTLINTTAEIVLLDLSDDYHLSREYDDSTGYDEIVAKAKTVL